MNGESQYENDYGTVMKEVMRRQVRKMIKMTRNKKLHWEWRDVCE